MTLSQIFVLTRVACCSGHILGYVKARRVLIQPATSAVAGA
jgi:hypothetical protein